MKDKVQDQVISLEHISIEKMLADPLTKGLPPNMFREHDVQRICSLHGFKGKPKIPGQKKAQR